MNARNRNRAAALVVLAALVIGCRQTTTIRTVPEGADVFVNSVRLQDKSPAPFESRTGFPSTARIKVDLDGYKPLRDVPLEKSYRADLSLLWLIPGIIPYFFTARFDDEITLELEKEGE